MTWRKRLRSMAHRSPASARHRRRARRVVQQRELAERLARTVLLDNLLAGPKRHDVLAALDDVEVVAGGALLDDDLGRLDAQLHEPRHQEVHLLVEQRVEDLVGLRTLLDRLGVRTALRHDLLLLVRLYSSTSARTATRASSSTCASPPSPASYQSPLSCRRPTWTAARRLHPPAWIHCNPSVRCAG